MSITTKYENFAGEITAQQVTQLNDDYEKIYYLNDIKIMHTTDKILIIDLEATCWENQPEYQRRNSEIIEIGAALLDTHTG